MDRNETLADISNMLREFSEAARAVNADLILDADDIADRIDAAVKRERDQFRDVTKLVGDVSKMRDALVEVARLDSTLKGRVLKGNKDAINLLHAVCVATSALSSPPRNCDVGTAEEQLERHRREVCDEYENSWEDPRTQCNGNCKACVARWLLAPAGQEGGK